MERIFIGRKIAGKLLFFNQFTTIFVRSHKNCSIKFFMRFALNTLYMCKCVRVYMCMWMWMCLCMCYGHRYVYKVGTYMFCVCFR